MRRKQNTKRSWRRRSTRVRDLEDVSIGMSQGCSPQGCRRAEEIWGPSCQRCDTCQARAREKKSSLRESVLRLRPAECDRNLLTGPRNERSRLRARQVVWLEILRDKAWIEPHELRSRHVCLLGPVQRHPRVRIEVFTQMGSTFVSGTCTSRDTHKSSSRDTVRCVEDSARSTSACASACGICKKKRFARPLRRELGRRQATAKLV